MEITAVADEINGYIMLHLSHCYSNEINVIIYSAGVVLMPIFHSGLLRTLNKVLGLFG